MPEQQDNQNWKEAERRIAKAKRTNAPELDLSGLNLTAIPDSFAQFTNLQLLNLSSNELTVLPDFLARLTSLQGLDLSGNHS